MITEIYHFVLAFWKIFRLAFRRCRNSRRILHI